jgi:Carboxypeptidase regulatory-like domain
MSMKQSSIRFCVWFAAPRKRILPLPFLYVALVCLVPGQASAASPSLEEPGAGIAGQITDSVGNPIEGATVTLSEATVIATVTATTNRDGAFRVPTLAGRYEIQIAAPGFVGKSIQEETQPGEPCDLGTIALAFEAGATEVVVSATRQELAQQEIQVEMRQRILGVVPNFLVTYDPNAAPLDAKQKYTVAMRTMVDPETIGVDLGISVMQQATGSSASYGKGAKGYARRFATSYGTGSIDTMLGSAVLPSLFKQDPRYFYKGTGSVDHRALYAMSMAVLCKGDNGHWQYNYSGLLGGLAAGGLANLYEPRSARQGLNTMFGNAAIGIGSSAISNLFQEFLIRKLVKGAR